MQRNMLCFHVCSSLSVNAPLLVHIPLLLADKLRLCIFHPMSRSTHLGTGVKSSFYADRPQLTAHQINEVIELTDIMKEAFQCKTSFCNHSGKQHVKYQLNACDTTFEIQLILVWRLVYCRLYFLEVLHYVIERSFLMQRE